MFTGFFLVLFGKCEYFSRKVFSSSPQILQRVHGPKWRCQDPNQASQENPRSLAAQSLLPAMD